MQQASACAAGASQTAEHAPEDYMSLRALSALDTAQLHPVTVFLLRELDSTKAELRALRAQRNDDDGEPVDEACGGKRRRAAQDQAFELYKKFDTLPGDGLVNIHVVALLYGCSVASIWRHLRVGLIPEPERRGGQTRWRVGTLRAALRSAQ